MRRSLGLFFSFDARLREELRIIAKHHQSAQLHRRGVVIWGAFAAVVIGLLGLRWQVEGFAIWLAPCLLVTLAAAIGLMLWKALRNELDLIAAARAIELEHPELKEALRTAAEQKPTQGDRLNFLQRRLLKHALDHAAVSAWHQTPHATARHFALTHLATLVVALAIAGIAFRTSAPWSSTWRQLSSITRAPAANEIEVTPGNQEVERGSTVVIAARFPKNLPAEATLVWQNARGETDRAAMARSLSDPVFAFTLTDVTSDTVYSIETAATQTADFALTVFELPDLLRADASLDYPDYTGQPDRTITDTRRISAVEGTQLDYRFTVNRPLASAELRADNGTSIALAPRNDDATLFTFTETLRESVRYKLHLIDHAGRTNPVPTDIRIEVAVNERPKLTLNFPRGDQRVSPIQEIHLNAEARDDFGLLDFGIATAIGSADPTYLSFKTNDAITREAQLNHLIALEESGVEVDELITWFVWADDFGSDGKRRRSTGDLFFAEVRPLDEIYREDESGGGGGQGAGQNGGPAGDLLEIQRQVSIAIWNLRESGDPGATEFVADLETLRASQAQAQTLLVELREQLDDPRLRGAADLADRSMELTLDELGDAASGPSLEPLDDAWKGSQSAFRALLRLQPKETNLVQNQSGSSGGGGRNRAQIDQLRMRRDANNYANQSQAESETSPEDREQLNLLSRLRELSRRQEDLNDRLQELQTALAAARTDAEREEIRRELKRLEEEQRRMLADLDEARQKLDRMEPGEQREQARQQLEDTRDNMQRAGEQLAQGEVSSALAAGTRAQQELRETSDQLRDNSSSVFEDQLRELRRQARELSEAQDKLVEQFAESADQPPSLDDSSQTESLMDAIQSQQQRHQDLVNDLRQVTEDSESTEPTLHRQLYDLMREQGTQGPSRNLEASAELLRRGFLEDAFRQQAGVGADFEKLRQGIERAADSVLGNEATEMRFANNELETLANELEAERQGAAAAEGESSEAAAGEERVASSENAESSTQPGTAPSEQLTESLSELLGEEPGTRPGGQPAPGSGPLTGRNFADWAERLRTVESLLEDEQLRERLGEARAQAEEQRRDWQREGKAPQWDLVEIAILDPLNEVRTRLKQELARRENPDSLQPIDRDPVPDKFTESVRRYYEALGGDNE